jgi:hypothetical protein
MRFRFALISTPRPIRAQRRGLLTIKCPVYHLRIDLITDLLVPISILLYLTKCSQKAKPRFVIVDVYRIERLRTTNPNYLVGKLRFFVCPEVTNGFEFSNILAIEEGS